MDKRNHRYGWLVLALGMTLLLSQGLAAQPLRQANDTTLRIINESEETICYVFISPVNAENWGDDWLGEDEAIRPGKTQDFAVSVGQYDVLLTDCDGNELWDERGLTLSDLYELHFTGPDLCMGVKKEGMTLYDQGKYQPALLKLQQALNCYQKTGSRTGEGIVKNIIGLTYSHLGQYAEALFWYQDALAIRREIGDQAGEGRSLNNIGVVYIHLGQYSEALKYSEQALTIFRNLEDLEGQGTTLDNIGGVYDNLGQYQEALKYSEQALDIRREIGDRVGEGISLNNIGHTYTGLEQYPEARQYFEQALIIQREIGDRTGEGATLNNIGFIYSHRGQYYLAIECYKQALAIRHEIGDRSGEGTSLNNIGSMYVRLEQYQEALEYFEQALIVRREIGDPAGEAVSLNNLGFIYNRLKQYPEALEYSEQALSIRHEIGDRAGEAESLANIGDLYEQQDQLDQALSFYQQSIEAHEFLRASASVEEFKTALAARPVSVDSYRRTILLLLKLDRQSEAFNLAERARARTLLDQLGNARISPTASDDPTLIQQEENLRGELQALERQLQAEWAKPKDQRNMEVIDSVTAQLETKRTAYARLLQSLKLTNPEYASLVTVAPLTLTETQKILTDTTLVEYFVTVSQTVAFVVTSDNFHAVPITITEESLSAAIKAFDLSMQSSLAGVPESLQTLYQTLIAPVEPYLKTDALIIAPHGVLHYIPFGALHDGEHYMVEKHTLSLIPSASILPFALEKRKMQVAAPLVLGDPDGSLPASRNEANAIATVYGVTARVGADALEQVMWEESGSAGIVHLATHGAYDTRSPLFSYVLLAGDDQEDGHLSVYEIYNRGLNLENADLVVLSACETNLGELSSGDEIVGLNRALIYAGTPSVIASLWTVSDDSTQVLMEKFYTHLRAGAGKAVALRAAQIEMIASGQYAHPYHWAAFSLTGDPGVVDAAFLPTPVPTLTEVASTPTPTPKPALPCGAALLPLALVAMVGVVGKSRRGSQ